MLGGWLRGFLLGTAVPRDGRSKPRSWQTAEVATSPPELSIDRGASVQRHQLDADSWVEIASGFVPEAAAHFDRLVDSVPWSQTEVLRYDRYVPEQRLSAGVRPEGDDLLRQTQLHLASRHRVRWDGVAAIWYRNGDDFQGMHSDREMRWLDDTLIAIVVLGARRPFVVRPRRPLREVAERVPAGEHPDDLVLEPGDGDLLIMGGACQRDWLHGIPKADTDQGRISLTWRWTSRRGRPDTNPTFYDGRSFSDGPHRAPTRSRGGRGR